MPPFAICGGMGPGFRLEDFHDQIPRDMAILQWKDFFSSKLRDVPCRRQQVYNCQNGSFCVTFSSNDIYWCSSFCSVRLVKNDFHKHNKLQEKSKTCIYYFFDMKKQIWITFHSSNLQHRNTYVKIMCRHKYSKHALIHSYNLFNDNAMCGGGSCRDGAYTYFYWHFAADYK